MGDGAGDLAGLEVAFFPEPLEGGLHSLLHFSVTRTYLPVQKLKLKILNITGCH